MNNRNAPMDNTSPLNFVSLLLTLIREVIADSVGFAKQFLDLNGVTKCLLVRDFCQQSFHEKSLRGSVRSVSSLKTIATETALSPTTKAYLAANKLLLFMWGIKPLHEVYKSCGFDVHTFKGSRKSSRWSGLLRKKRSMGTQRSKSLNRLSSIPTDTPTNPWPSQNQNTAPVSPKHLQTNRALPHLTDSAKGIPSHQSKFLESANHREIVQNAPNTQLRLIATTDRSSDSYRRPKRVKQEGSKKMSGPSRSRNPEAMNKMVVERNVQKPTNSSRTHHKRKSYMPAEERAISRKESGLLNDSWV
ncbi:hypothetical protein Ciccas_009987 [Cichlidogyrus casuarinus]|uniref:Uncharacterized protein n=1 Tax=Cichlidogyrus casuarinus TaxID=1844966 RepID=A0ABD2PWH2_9PLAT